MYALDVSDPPDVGKILGACNSGTISGTFDGLGTTDLGGCSMYSHTGVGLSFHTQCTCNTGVSIYIDMAGERGRRRRGY